MISWPLKNELSVEQTIVGSGKWDQSEHDYLFKSKQSCFFWNKYWIFFQRPLPYLLFGLRIKLLQRYG